MKLIQKYCMCRILLAVILVAFVFAYIIPVEALAEEMGNAFFRPMVVLKWSSKKLFNSKHTQNITSVQNSIPLHEFMAEFPGGQIASVQFQKPPEGGPEFIEKKKGSNTALYVILGVVGAGGIAALALGGGGGGGNGTQTPTKGSAIITIPWPE